VTIAGAGHALPRASGRSKFQNGILITPGGVRISSLTERPVRMSITQPAATEDSPSARVDPEAELRFDGRVHLSPARRGQAATSAAGHVARARRGTGSAG
jgi:hypothetical protein